jgi:ADP-ribosylglycohydrolase
LVRAARAQTAFTHGDPAVVEAAEYFARVTFRVREGESIPAALRTVAQERAWEAIPQSWFEAAKLSARSEVEDREAAREQGLTCHIPDAFPVILHFLLRYPEDGLAALEANLRAGGDNASRGMILGMVYGAQSDAIAAYPGWVDGLSARDEIEFILNRTPAYV